MTKETLTVESDFVPLDLLLWRRFGSEEAGRVEAALSGNPGLAAQDEYLAVGTEVVVDVPAPAAVPVVRVRRLWG